MKIVSWFSCGNNSAVASKLALRLFPNDEIAIARIVIDNEHLDNERFHADCERWFDHEIVRLRSTEYRDCWDVWERKSYISGVHGAPCTTELKKAVRWQFERDWCPDAQVFGYSVDEGKRAGADYIMEPAQSHRARTSEPGAATLLRIACPGVTR